MDELTLKSQKDISAVFHSPEVNDAGLLEYYSLTVSAQAMEATVRVENVPYGTNPVDFFERVATEWKGWKGEKDWVAMEGEFSLVGKTDSTGHMELTLKLQPSYYAPCWSSKITLIIEAGQLDSLARKARSFFYPSSNK